MIGDAAADAAITAIEAADVAPQRRPILTHCQVKECFIVISSSAKFLKIHLETAWLDL